MAIHQDYYNWRPSSDQELLLTAALQSGDLALQAWQKWSERLDLDQLDYGSRRLLPLLYHNLKAEGIDHPLMNQFKKMYIDTWAQNQIVFAKITPLLKSFREAGIETLLLKGAAMNLRYYRDYGLRPMSDFDVLVPNQRAFEAIGLVRQMGWKPQLKSPNRSLAAYLSVNHALHCLNPAQFDLDLHWHVLDECLGSDADLDFWEGADPGELNGVQTLCLNSADHLFHTCIHGARWNQMPPIRWVADAMTILKYPVEIDWKRMIGQAEKSHLSLSLRTTLKYLIDRYNAPVPSDFMKNLTSLPVTEWEFKEYQTWIRQPYANVPVLWAYYPRIAKDTGRHSGLLGFIKYLQDYWELEHIWQVPPSFGWRILIKVPGFISAGGRNCKRYILAFFGLIRPRSFTKNPQEIRKS
jgi:hypothetical protein